LLSLSIKLFFLVQDSTFDGRQRFTLEIKHSNRETSVVTFEPVSNSISILSIKHNKEMVSAQKSLLVPIDGVIGDPSESVNKSNLRHKLYSYMLRITSGKGVNSFDIARLIIFTQGLQDKDIDMYEIGISDVEPSVLNEVFVDRRIVDESQTIAIVNAANSAGLGTRLEGILSRLGMNVVSVTTASSVEKTSRIEYADESSYTFSRVKNKLAVPVEESSELGISDILIVLGEDFTERIDF